MKFENNLLRAESRRREAEKKGLLSLSHWRGELHAHTRSDISQPLLPEEIVKFRRGSNCGKVPFAALASYCSQEMLNDYLAITEHSRDGNPKKAVPGITDWFESMYLANEDWIKEVFSKTADELNSKEREFIREKAGEQAEKVALYQDERLRDGQKEIDEYSGNMKVYKGVEANLLPNGEFDTEMVAKGEFDLVNCSIHPQVKEDEFREIFNDPEKYTELVVAGIKNPKTNIMCHIGYNLPADLVERLDWDEMLDEAIKNQVAIEINLKELSVFLNKTISDYKKFPKSERDYLRLFEEKLPELIPLLSSTNIRGAMKKRFKDGLLIAINTDVHEEPRIEFVKTKDDLSFEFKQASFRFWRCLKKTEEYFNDFFRETGADKENIINTFSQEKLELFFKKQL